MTTLTMASLVVEAHPTTTEVAILALPAGAVARVHHPSGEVREYGPDVLPIPWYVVVPGDKAAIGWGCADSWYGDLKGIRNGHRPVDRQAWHDAADALRAGGVAYVTYELLDYHGNDRWTATGVRWTPLSVPAEIEEPAHA